MYQKIKKLLFHTLIPAVLTVFLLPSLAFADEEACTVSIPVEIQVAGTVRPPARVYRLVLERVTPDAPMPETAQLLMESAGTTAFGEIKYQIPGDYRYQIRQTSEAVDRFTDDQRVYSVTVRVTRDEDGKLASQIWATSDTSSEQKVEQLVFVNQYVRRGSSGGSSGGGTSSGGGGTSSGGPGAAGDGLTAIDDGVTPLAGLFGDGITEVLPDGIVPLAMLPQTGDTTCLALWFLLMILSGSGLSALLINGRRSAAWG